MPTKGPPDRTVCQMGSLCHSHLSRNFVIEAIFQASFGTCNRPRHHVGKPEAVKTCCIVHSITQDDGVDTMGDEDKAHVSPDVWKA